MDTADTVQAVTQTLYDFCTLCDEARHDELVALFCEDGCGGRALSGMLRFGSLRLPY